jgi:hypothetical protein
MSVQIFGCQQRKVNEKGDFFFHLIDAMLLVVAMKREKRS